MILKWSDYLRSHPANQDYDANPEAIKNLVLSNESETTNFRNLTDNKSLLLLTKSDDNELQTTFFHTLFRKSIADPNPKHFALTGFGTRATAVILKPEDIFRQTTQNRKVPSLAKLIQCTTLGEVEALPTPEARKIDY